MFKQLALAFGFLTVIPMPQVKYESNDLGKAGKWFPFVGLVIGAILFGAESAMLQAFRPLLCGALTVSLWVLLTGGLHLDGLADCCDGLAASVSAERRLEIMRDPRMGAFGGMGLSLFLILKVLGTSPTNEHRFALLFAPVVARYSMLLVTRQRAARPGGLGDTFSKELGIGSLMVASIIPLGMIPLGYYCFDCQVLVSGFALLASVGTSLLMSLIARIKLGGITGDVLGLAVETSELAVLLVFASNAEKTFGHFRYLG
jgi:adenosylcobinamide-GDP ribazoletransferase